MFDELRDKPPHLIGSCVDYSTSDIEWVAEQFRIASPIKVGPFPGKGNINLHTYHVHAGDGEYLLQKVNSDVFKLPYRVMNSMLASIDAQNAALASGHGDEVWQPIELIQTRDEKAFLDLTDEHGWSVWRLMVRIPDAISYKSLSELDGQAAQLTLAEEVGRGLAIYSDLTASIDPSTIDGSLPGYRDTGLYFSQFHSVMACNRTLHEADRWLPKDAILRESTGQHFLVALTDEEYQARKNDSELASFIELVCDREPFAMGLWKALESHEIRHTLIHGDTKIENFLFCAKSGRVKALVDLDTIMPFTWLADWGDLQRSMVNVAGEKETDLTKVKVDRDVYEAVAKGFLKAATQVTEAEIALMVPAVQAITLELGLRFMTDYLKGDTYFQLGPDDPADLNKTRAMVQLTLYERLVEFGPEAEAIIAKYRPA
ncbi:MAG: phosphotransferase [Fimbriimonas sp.]|nr:phosphotransferase [Fimbriimonas sp.]